MKKGFDIYTVHVAAQKIGCCAESIRRACRSKQLRHVKRGVRNTIYINEFALEEWDVLRKLGFDPKEMKSVREEMEMVEEQIKKGKK